MRRGVLLLLVIAGLLLSYHLDKPFIGHHDWNGVFWGNMAREYIRGHITYFSHYTPLLPFLFSLSGLVFGIHEWSLRLVSVCFSLVMLIAIYKIGELLYGRATGLLAMALMIATPMFLYFGKLPDHEPIVTSLITIAFYFYLRLGEKSQKIRYYFFSALLLAFLESWASYFLIPFLFLHALLFGKKRLPIVFCGIIIGIVVVALHISLIFLFNGSEGLTNFLHAGTFRLNLDTSSKNLNQFTWPQFVVTEGRYSVIYFTRILLVLSGVWGIRVMLSLRRKARASDVALLVLFLTGASFILLLSNLSYIHDYKLYLLLPFISIASAETLVMLATTIEKRMKKWQLVHIATGIFIMFIVIATATERMKYLQTLLNTSFNSPGYQLGLLINQKTDPGELVLVDSLEFASFYDVFVTYYADRPVSFGDITINQFQEHQEEYRAYRYLVLIKNRPTDAALTQYLLETYESQADGDFTFVDLQKARRGFAENIFD